MKSFGIILLFLILIPIILRVIIDTFFKVPEEYKQQKKKEQEEKDLEQFLSENPSDIEMNFDSYFSSETLGEDEYNKITKDSIPLPERELFVKALINCSFVFNQIEGFLYNPQNMLFSTKALKFIDPNKNDVYDSPKEIYDKFENISKILIANVVLQSMDIVLKEEYNLYIPSSRIKNEFGSLNLNYEKGIGVGRLLYVANSIIYTAAQLKLFEETIKNRNKKKEYKDMIKNYLQAFVENEGRNGLNIANSYVKEEFAEPMQSLYYLLISYTR